MPKRSSVATDDVECVVKVLRAGLVTFIKNAEPRKLVEVAAFIDRIENSDPTEVRPEVLRAFQREAAKRR